MELKDKYIFDKKAYDMKEYHGRVVFLSNKYRKWFRVGNTAKDILMLMDGEKSLGDIIQDISQEYEIPYSQVKEDIFNFCDAALQNGYILDENNSIEDEMADDFLSNIYINVTSECNFSCNYCNCKQNQQREIDFEALKNYIEELIKVGRIRNTTVNITGGEPLLCKELKEILYFFKQKSLPIVLWTNGTYIDTTNIQWIKDTCTYVIFPIDSDKREINDAIRSEGAYEATLRAVELCNEYKVEFMCAFTPTETTFRDMEQLALFVEKIGAVSLIVNEPIGEDFYGEKIGHFGFTEKEFTDVYMDTADKAVLIKSWQNYKSDRRAFTVQRTREVCLNNIYYILHKNGCGMYKNELLIDCDGKIYPCHMLYKAEFACGDIYGGCVEVLPDIVRNENQYDSCNECQMKFICLGNCKAYRYYVKKQLEPVKSECDEYRKKTTEYMFGIYE